MRKNYFTHFSVLTVFTILTLSCHAFAAKYQFKNVTGIIKRNSRTFIQITVSGKPPKKKMKAVCIPKGIQAKYIKTINNVPVFEWSYGCSATAAGMAAGYYDRIGYDDIFKYDRCPMVNNWGYTVYENVVCAEVPFIATHSKFDKQFGHVDDYFYDYISTKDPYLGVREPHSNNCIADFMGTSQYKKHGMKDGATHFYFDESGAAAHDFIYNPADFKENEPIPVSGIHGLKQYYKWLGYEVTANYSQFLKGFGKNPDLGFTFEDYQHEIDNKRPVIIHIEGHSMLGFGYHGPKKLIYIHDTWDNNSHEMPWGGTYADMQHYGVSVINIKNAQRPDSVAIYNKTSIIYSLQLGNTSEKSYVVLETLSSDNSSGEAMEVVLNPKSKTYVTKRSGISLFNGLKNSYVFNYENPSKSVIYLSGSPRLSSIKLLNDQHLSVCKKLSGISLNQCTAPEKGNYQTHSLSLNSPLTKYCAEYKVTSCISAIKMLTTILNQKGYTEQLSTDSAEVAQQAHTNDPLATFDSLIIYKGIRKYESGKQLACYLLIDFNSDSNTFGYAEELIYDKETKLFFTQNSTYTFNNTGKTSAFKYTLGTVPNGSFYPEPLIASLLYGNNQSKLLLHVNGQKKHCMLSKSLKGAEIIYQNISYRSRTKLLTCRLDAKLTKEFNKAGMTNRIDAMKKFQNRLLKDDYKPVEKLAHFFLDHLISNFRKKNTMSR